MSEILYIDRLNSKIKMYKTILKKQFNVTCREEINNHYAKNAINNLNFGLIVITPRNLNRYKKRGESDNYELNAFALCEDVNDELYLSLLCSNSSHKGFGKILIDEIFKICLMNKISRISLITNNKIKLIAYYESFGFEHYESLSDGKVSMVKRLT